MSLLLVSIALIAFSSWMIARACNGFEEAADYLGRNLTEGTKGATINAIGSSMPEVCVTFIYLFLFVDTTGFAGGIGTTAGSAVFNGMVIPSLVILVVLWKNRNLTITVSRAVILRDGITLIFAEFFLIYFIGDTLEWYHGLALMLIYAAYAGWMIYRHQTSATAEDEGNEEADEENQEPNGSPRWLAFFTIDLEHAMIGSDELNNKNSLSLLAVATLFITAACWILVYACETIGHELGIHGYFVAVVIAAAASSVPDTILSIKDANKGNYADAISNALGSNIFDICFALGAPLFLFTLINGPIAMQTGTAGDIAELRILLLTLTIVSVVLFLIYKQMTQSLAYTLLAMYGVFVVFVVGKAYQAPFAMEIAEQLQTIQKLIF